MAVASTERLRLQLIAVPSVTPIPSPTVAAGVTLVNVRVTVPACETMKVRLLAPPAASELANVGLVGDVAVAVVAGEVAV